MEVLQALLPESAPQTPSGSDRRCGSGSPGIFESTEPQMAEVEELEEATRTERLDLHHPDDAEMAGNHGETSSELEAMAINCEPPSTQNCLEECEAELESLKRKYAEECLEKEAALTEASEARKNCAEVCGPRYVTLMKKYTEECQERKRLYNELVEMKGNIRVFCRCRPLSREEVSKGSTDVFDFDASQDTELQIVCSDSSRKQFKFDHVFSPTASQESVFAETLLVIKSVLDGFNVCIFAYGQTGSGKTFTMEGTEENRGVNYRALEELFKVSGERSASVRYEFSVSMLEVYNEKIRDLLVDSSQQGKKLEIKQSADGTQEVPGLVEAQAYNPDDVWELLSTGKRNRAVGSTNANELSSRSHCLLRVTIKGENLASGQRVRSSLWLVDLAGSERVGKIEVEGERLKESQFINKSLSALGDVISALATKSSHIPYRNSKLTHLLQSSLGGDCKTLMFVQISPSSADLGETICSLNFATRVRGIEQGPARRQLDPAESFKFKQLMEKLRLEEKENAKLNESLQLMHLKYASRENVFKTLQEKIKDLESQLAEERRNRQQQESKDTLLKYHNRPPLPPIRERPPLSKITANVVRFPPGRRNSITAYPSSIQDKENFTFGSKKPAREAPGKAPLRAQRVLVVPVSKPAAPKRRVSIASFPSFSQKQSDTSMNLQQNFPAPFPRPPRRRSMMPSFLPVPMTPVASTPVGNSIRTSSFFMPNDGSSSKFSSPQQQQQPTFWKSKIPMFASPRQRLRLQSTPGSTGQKNATPGKKICFSIQKRLVIGSPAQLQPQRLPMLEANQGREVTDKFAGGARRILCKNPRNRRVSVA